MPEELEMKLIDIQCDSVFRDKFGSPDTRKCYEFTGQKYPTTAAFSIGILSIDLFLQMFFLTTVMDVYKPAPVNYCTNFTLTAIATLFTYDSVTPRVAPHLRTEYGSERLTLAKHSPPSLCPL
ncbi:hypothetical protein RF11_00588 [Thelohanellus kitauei]|uniref:Uncharacterized protein n=1 Tax=Thelohanellus kitauei TaxID=669202 RepID=A0A0C2I6L4_THEKT|nr:hypothetical protein RF11_00588 [Thelohanellus kitauei]